MYDFKLEYNTTQINAKSCKAFCNLEGRSR